MRILGLVASARKLGNSEILVKESLASAKERGCSIGLIRLADLNIKPCNGCMQCVFKGARCAIRDDMYFLLENIKSSDGIILGAPTYILGPSGIIKMITDRLYMVSSLEREHHEEKPAATIAVAGIAGWEPFTLPLLNMLPLSMGFRLVDSFIAHVPGPGEVLLHDEFMKRAAGLGARVSGSSESTGAGRGQKPHCPLCRGSFFHIIGESRGECPSCAIKGSFKIENGESIVFHPDNSAENRWTRESITQHTESWVRVTEGLFKKHLREVLERRKPYREMDNLWIRPES